MSPYTVNLLGIKCLAAQEIDGDEIEIKFNSQVIWHSGQLKMHEHLPEPQIADEIDFAGGHFHHQGGWSPLPDFNAQNFVFSGLQESSRFELHEEDAFWGDDLLGSAPVSERDAGRGKISIVFSRNGANYILFYEVSASA